MEPLIIEQTAKTPYVFIDSNEGVMEIKGMSASENAPVFYKPVLDWLDNYGYDPKPVTKVNVQFKYFNTSSAKCILDVLERFANLNNSGIEVTVNWYYEKNDEEMFDAGENFSQILEMPFNIQELTKN
jgi:hypothetical protein